MNRHVALFLVAAITAMATTSCVEQVVRRIHPDQLQNLSTVQDEGVLYRLPRTVIDIEIPFRKTTTGASPFLTDLHRASVELRDYVDGLSDQYSYEESDVEEAAMQIRNPLDDPRYVNIAFRLNRLGIVPRDRGATRFEMGDIQVSTRAEPDPCQIYLVEVRGGLFTDRKVALELTETGLLSSGQLEAKDKRIDLAIKTLKVASDIAALTSTGKWPIRDFRDNPVRRILEFAEETIDEIEKVRDRRRDLVGGQGSDPGLSVETLERMLAELDTMERSLASYFAPSRVEEWTGRFSVAPDGDDLRKNVNVLVCYFSEDNGIYPADARGRIRDVPVPSEFQAQRRGLPVTISVTTEDPTSPGRTDGEHVRGFPYRIPAPTTAVLRIGSHEQVRAQLAVAQLGTLAFLPAGTGSPESTVDVSFYPESGSLRSVRTSSLGLDPEDIEQLGKVVGPLIQQTTDIEDRVKELQEKVDELR